MHFAEVENYVTQYFCKILPDIINVFATPQTYKRGDVFKINDYKQGVSGSSDLVISTQEKLHSQIPNSLYGLLYYPPHKNKVGKKYVDVPEKLVLCHYFDNDILKLDSVYKTLKIEPARLIGASATLSKKTGSTNRCSGIQSNNPDTLQYNDYTGVSDERYTSLVVRVYGKYNLESGLDLFNPEHVQAFTKHLKKNPITSNVPFDIKKVKPTSNKVTIPQLTDFTLTVKHKPDRLLFDNSSLFSNNSKLEIASSLLEHKQTIYDHYKKLGFTDNMPWSSRYTIVSDDKPTQLLEIPYEVHQSVHEKAVLPEITFKMPNEAVNELLTRNTFTGNLEKIDIQYRMKTFLTYQQKAMDLKTYGVHNIHKGQLSVLH